MKKYVKKIGETTYEVTSFSAIEGIKIDQKLTKILSSIEITDFGNVSFSSAIDKLIEFDRDLSLSMELLSRTLSDGVVIQQETFNKVFNGKLGEYIEILVYVVEVNFQDFFYTVQREINRISNKTQEETKEQKA